MLLWLIILFQIGDIGSFLCHDAKTLFNTLNYSVKYPYLYQIYPVIHTVFMFLICILFAKLKLALLLVSFNTVFELCFFYQYEKFKTKEKFKILSRNEIIQVRSDLKYFAEYPLSTTAINAQNGTIKKIHSQASLNFINHLFLLTKICFNLCISYLLIKYRF